MALSLDTSSVPRFYVDHQGSYQLTASGGTTPYSWSVDTLPAGLSLDNSGTISGTPTATASTSSTFTVTDSASGSDSKTLTVNVSEVPAVRLSKANAELAYVAQDPKARISKATGVTAAVAQQPRVRVSKANALAVHGWPLVRQRPTTLANETSGTDSIASDTITVMPFACDVKGKARSVRVLPKEDNATVNFRSVIYGSDASGAPAGLIRLGDTVTGCTTDVPVDLPLPGGVDVGFGNYFVGLWTDQDLSVGNTNYEFCYKQNLAHGSDPGLTFSGSIDEDGVPRLLVNVLQPDREHSFGAVIPETGGNSDAQYPSETVLLACYYNLHEVQYEAATFTIESDNDYDARFRVAVYADDNGSPGELLMVSADTKGAYNSINTVVTFPNPVTLTQGLYFLAVVADKQINYATTGTTPTFTNAAKFSVTDIDNLPDPAPTETGTSDAPLVQLLYQPDPPILPGLKSPVLATWAGVGDTGANFVTDFSRVTEDGTLRVLESGYNRETEDASKDFYPYADSP